MQPKVSVIVPVYNVEKYIEKCCRSLFEQTLPELEILFINDCTPDNSIEVIESTLADYPDRVQNVRIIDMPQNGGQAKVRTKGILEATGEYVIHCDGDDWVDQSLYERMYEKALMDKADMVICGQVWEYKNHKIFKEPNIEGIGKELFINWYKNVWGLHFHTKLVRRRLYIDNQVLPWDDLNMWEDNGVFGRLFYYTGIVSKLNFPLYYHYNKLNQTAITTDYGLNHIGQMIEVARRLEEFYISKEDGADFNKTINAIKYFARINLIKDSFKNYRRFLKTFPESDSIKTELDTGGFSNRGKIRFYFVRAGFAWLFIILYKIKNILALR